ncbi:hypothetical protein BX666DRAFT_2001185 [Dichotomocladium elegans]|nr:hypothetical protein BX666DRAFT_2001185 [Dichotomocladium elegans]
MLDCRNVRPHSQFIVNVKDEEMRQLNPNIQANGVLSSSSGVKRAAQHETQKPTKKRVCQKHDESL